MLLNRHLPEKTMHAVRWALTIGWLMLIASLFYDPITAVLTDPNNLASPLRLNPAVFDPKHCVKIRETCIVQSPYPIGAMVWWICPLSFLSQIPRALGIQRQRRIVDPKTGSVRRELVRISEQSWLGQNHLYVQFGLFVLGLGLRILLVNCHRVALGSFLLFTIASAITVGYLYAGKSWCHYFCPMAPVQLVYTGPRSLFGSDAFHTKTPGITQSSCRTIDLATSQEQSACVGCRATCMDIDAEKNYWTELKKPGRRLVQYGYFGMVVAFYLYYFLYAGNWNYFFSGAWTHEDKMQEKPWDEIFEAGFYLYGQTIGIPKVLAVFITFGVMMAITFALGLLLEKLCRRFVVIKGRAISAERSQHIVFTLFTVASFWTFFSYGARPLLNRMPTLLLLGFNAVIVLVGSIWLFRTIQRQHQDYDRESMASSLRQQLKALAILDSTFLEGHPIDDLSPDALYTLVKLLPRFSAQLRRQTYQGVLQDCLEQKTVTPRLSFEFCASLRQQLQLDDACHFEVLAEIISHPLNLDDIQTNNSPAEDVETIARTICKRIKDDVADPNNQATRIFPRRKSNSN
jgi:hypothetical protein